MMVWPHVLDYVDGCIGRREVPLQSHSNWHVAPARDSGQVGRGDGDVSQGLDIHGVSWCVLSRCYDLVLWAMPRSKHAAALQLDGAQLSQHVWQCKMWQFCFYPCLVVVVFFAWQGPSLEDSGARHFIFASTAVFFFRILVNLWLVCVLVVLP